MDSQDVFQFPCDRSVAEELRQASVDILFNLDWACYPDEWKTHLYPSENVQLGRYLNSGAYIGKVRHILHFIELSVLSGFSHMHSEIDDQRFWTDMFLGQNHNTPSIGIDVYGKVFQPWWAKHGYWQTNIDTGFVKREGTWENSACFIHGSGKGKIEIQAFVHDYKLLMQNSSLALPHQQKVGANYMLHRNQKLT